MLKITNSRLFSYLCFFLASPLLSAPINKITTEITLDGKKTPVYFNDGDTFKILEGKNKNSSVRIAGFNALETYGPVHGWEKNTPEYLYDVSSRATKAAQNGSWNCNLEGGKDAYNRLLANCDDLAGSLISQGLAHAYSVDGEPAKKEYLTKQKSAQRKKLGMWKGGTPEFIITSLHSIDEGAKDNYNRLISATDGHTEKWSHKDSYDTCENVCLDKDSCMIYVPFGQRYSKNKPECLLSKKF